MTEGATGSGATGSTVPRRQLGRYLRDLRNKPCLTIRAAAEALEWSETKIWRIETGHTSMRSLDVETMCRIYGAPVDTTEALMALAKETKARGWWLSYSDVLPEGFDVYLGLEEAAARLQSYQSELIPGLLQTEPYARTMIQAGTPGLSEAEIERRVQVRIQRQALLGRVTSPPELNVVLNEAILRRPVGGAKLMAAQLAHLLEMAELVTVTVKVMPFDAGMHHGIVARPFVMLDFPTNSNGTPTEPPVVYMEGFTGELYLDKAHEVDQYSGAFTDLWSASLDEATSRSLIADTVKELGE
ncbi:MAG: helix-turn-helix domain-containing protein [Pseudonocardia sp.]